MNSLPPPEQFLEQLQRLTATDIEAEIARRDAERQRKAAIEEDREACKSLSEFIKRAWHVIEPGTPYTHGWHISAIAEHLEAVYRGELRRLMIAVPPGTSKSTAVGVFFPMWCWGPMQSPWMRFVGVAHEQTLGVRDNLKCRRLVQSEWFQERWPTPIASDQNEKLNFENSSTGFRAVATPSNITGKRANVVVCDDPISVENANSVVEREKVNQWFAESLPTRLNDPERSAIVLVMQRIHEDDPIGMITSKGWGWDFLMLPMRFEPSRRCETSIGFKDPRTKEGELLFPARFPEHVVAELERTMGAFASAGQLQQRPVPREGAMFKRQWFRTVDAVPAGTRFVRYWDLAATSDQFGADPAWTAGVLLGMQPDGRYIVADVNRLRAEGVGVRRMIKETARDDGRFVEIGFPQDPGQAGKVQAQDLTNMLAGYLASSTIETGDKITRAEPIAAQAEAGNIDVLKADWNSEFFQEITTFPGSRFKDQVDALSGAFSRLMRAGMFKTPETQFSIDPVNVASIWSRVAAIDISPTMVSIVWGAFHRTPDVLYVYNAVSVPRQDIAIHADQLTRKDRWTPVLFDMEAHKRGKTEGYALAQSLADRGVNLMTISLDMEAGAEQIATRLARGGLRVFSSLPAWFAEYRRIGRDEKGQMSDAENGIIRATAKIVCFGLDVAVTENQANSDAQGFDQSEYDRPNSSTGY